MYNYPLIIKHARELRRKMTSSEKLLWERLKNRKLSGYKFLRQHPIIYKEEGKIFRYFVADFYCAAKSAVIELDGPIHEKTLEYDVFRDNEMRIRDIVVLRIKNEELDEIEAVLQKIILFLQSL